MIKINLIKRQGFLIPSLEEDVKKLAKIKAGVPFAAEVTKNRNSKCIYRNRCTIALIAYGKSNFETLKQKRWVTDEFN